MKLRISLICFAVTLVILAGCGGKKTETEPPKRSAARKEQSGKKPDSGKPNAQEPSMPTDDGIPSFPGLIQPRFGFDDLLGSGKAPIPPADHDSQPTDGGKTPEPPPALVVGERPTAQQLLAALQQTYRATQSVRVVGTMRMTLKQDGKAVGPPQDVKLTMLFKRPNKFASIEPGGRFSSDGKSLYSYQAASNTYAKMPMTDEVLQSMAASQMGVGVMGLLLGADYLPAVSSTKLLKDTKIGGTQVYVLSLKLKKGVGCPPEMDATQTLWIGKDDLAIYKNQLVATAKPKPIEGYKGPLPKIVHTTTVGTVTRFEHNVKLADSAFRPPPGAKPFEPPKQVDLKNKPAPDFSFKWTDGSEKKLSDFRGKTVILSCWAVPGCEELLPVLQEVYEKHAGEVEMVTVNFNDKPEDVQKYLKEKGFSFPTIYVDDQTLGMLRKRYGVHGLPMMFIIDDKGIVRRIMVGVPTAKDIAAKLANVQSAQ